MKRKKTNMVKSFLDRHGITQMWVASRLGITPGTLDFFTGDHGFREDVATAFVYTLHSVGKKLSKFKFGKDHVTDFDYLKNECGIQHRHLGNQLGIKISGSLAWRVKCGLSASEQVILMASLKETAQACSAFELPKESIRQSKAA